MAVTQQEVYTKEQQILILEQRIRNLSEENCSSCGGSGPCTRCERGRIQIEIDKLKGRIHTS
jgi:hypothetical protein